MLRAQERRTSGKGRRDVAPKEGDSVRTKPTHTLEARAAPTQLAHHGRTTRQGTRERRTGATHAKEHTPI